MSRKGFSFSSPRGERTLFAGGLAAISISAAILRIHDLGLAAYDCDELYAVRIQGGSLKDAAALVGRSAFHDLHPPLSYLLFMIWVRLFGTQEATVRTLSLLLGLGSVVLLGFLGRRIAGAWAGLAGAAFLAFNPLHIAYSQEARPYALAVMLVTAAHLFFLRSLGEGTARNRIAYAFLSVAALYTHYFALFALLPHGVIALWLLATGDEDSRRAARRTLLAFACAMAAFLAWLPALLFQTAGEAEGPQIGIYDLGGSPLARTGVFIKHAAGLGGPPFLLPAAAAMLMLLALAFTWRERLPAGAGSESGPPPRWPGALLLSAGLLLAAALRFLAPRYLFPPARQVLLSKGYSPGAIERELNGMMGFTVSLPAALGLIGLLLLGWPWLSSLLGRWLGRSSREGRPLAINAFLAFLLLVPVIAVLALALRDVPFLSDRNLLIFEPALALALGVGAARLARVRWARLVLVPAVGCLALAAFHYQSVSGVFGVRGEALGIQTGAWRDLARELDRRNEDDLPLVLVDAPRSDPAEFYLNDHPFSRIAEDGRTARSGLPHEFRFVHMKGNPNSEALLSRLSGMASLEPRFQVDEFVIYHAVTHAVTVARR
ncbi:MAG: glycosyltransferase family 39 protein [Thermoanaerobaculia bacterium]